MPSISIKLVCPRCFQIARSTNSQHYLICGYCNCRMVPAPDRCPRPLYRDHVAPLEPSLEDLNRSLDE